MIELHERLQGNIVDKTLNGISVGNLGTAYYSIGSAQKAIVYYEQALSIARDTNDKGGEGAWLGNLGNAYSDLGDVEKVIEVYQQALTIARDVGDKRGEGINLGNLGTHYTELGDVDKAIDYYQQAITIKREIGDKRSESTNLENLGTALLDKGDWKTAEQHYRDATAIADEISFNQTQHWARYDLALLHLYQDDLASAQQIITLALSYDMPENNHNAHVLRGMITLRQGDKATARESFETTLSACDDMLAMSVDNFKAKDAKGLALCGLALLDGDANKVTEAKAVFHSARTKTKNLIGVIRRVQRQFDALAVVDSGGLLAGVREAIAGD